MTLTAEQRVILEARLTEAEDALHQLAIGNKARVFVDQNGERVEFAMTSMDRLRAYVMNLKVQLGKPTGVSGPMTPWML
jgi:hypothetical protein